MVQIYEPRSFPVIQEYYKILKSSKMNILDVRERTTITLGEGVELRILGVQNSNILENFINNSSLVFMVRSKTKSVLFLGDLGVEGGKKVLENFSPKELKADYVQIAHHGQGGVNKDFYEVVDARYALWPTPDWLWENNMEAKGKNSGTWDTFTVRKWMKDLNVKKNYVAGLEGTIQID
jgi:beta-lactamase superfamily II metal-dependent hydrolase